MNGVPWRRAALTLVAVATAATSTVVVLRNEGFSAFEAAVPRATRWFVDSPTGRLVLADGFSGRALARIDVGLELGRFEIAQSASGVALLDRTAGTVSTIDPADLRLGPPQSLSLLGQPGTIVGVAQPGLIAVDPETAQGVLLPPGGEQVTFALDAAGAGDDPRIAPDGGVWTLAAGQLARVTTSTRDVIASGLGNADFTLVGSTGFVLDVDRRRARLGTGDWVELPATVAGSEFVLQQPGPTADCGWIGGDDLLWCIGSGGPVEQLEIEGLGIDGADLLAVGGDAAALVRRATATIERIDWRQSRVVGGGEPLPSVRPGADLSMSASNDLVWVDDTNGSLLWAIHPWGIEAIDKSDDRAPLISDTGEVLEPGQSGSAATRRNDQAAPTPERPPDGDGIDDPPVAIDDPVTARTGSFVAVAVTANDFDPDGEAIAVVEADDGQHGRVELVSADVVAYQPEAGFVGLDRFTYTIVDGNGTTATATVTIELLAAGASNQAPVGAPDTAETGPDTPVVIDVLLNDIDPERDLLRIGSFTPVDVGGEVSATIAPSGLPGLLFRPLPGVSGTASFSYRPVDVLGAIGEPVEVQVEIAQPGDENRPPRSRPDAVRVRRDIPVPVPVLANDVDPDGDRLRLDLVRPLPPGLQASVSGDRIVVTARAGVKPFTPFAYTIDDGRGNVVTGSVLVVLIDELEPNRPPVANADTATSVTGARTVVDVLANDTDPDGDPIVLVSVRPSDGTAPVGSIAVRGDRLEYTAPGSIADDDVLDRFIYEINDGNGNEASGEVTVRVLAEAVDAPPYARDDSATTTIDVAITIDVLGNDGDPSGERPGIVAPPGCASGGTAALTPDERVTFTPPPGRAGIFNCSYEVANSSGRRATATIVITVLQPPIANVAPEVTDEDEVIEINTVRPFDVLANDVDPDGSNQELRLLSSSRPVLGAAARDGRVIVFDAGPVTGVATITYQVGDPGGGVSTGRLTLRIVEPEPQPPSAVDDRRTIVGPATSTAIDVVANDSDPDGSILDLSVRSASLTGTIGTIQTSDRLVTITPPPDFVGELVATYVLVDGDGLTDTGTVTLTVLETPNRAPIARPDSGQVVNGGSVTIALGLNDEDPDGDPLTYRLTSPEGSSLGTAQLVGTSIQFQSVPGSSGVAAYEYEISDGEAVAVASVTIDVLPCSAAQPSAPDVFLQTGYQQPIYVDLNAVAGNGEVVSVGPPLNAAAGVYTPPAGENGNISFEYVVRNACRIVDVGRVTIDVNQEPVASAFQTRIGRTEPVTIPVSSLASDAEPLTINGIENAPAWVTVVDGQGLRVDPAGQVGRADLVAVISDPGGLTVRVPVAIELVNLAPIANPDVVRADRGPVVFAPLANDSDPDGDLILLQSVPASIQFPNGEIADIERLADDTLRINPRNALGTATFTYTIVDGPGLVSDEATVTVVVNSPPVAPPVDILMPADSTQVVDVPAFDPDGDPLVLELLDDPSPLTITVEGLRLTVTAPLEAAGTQYSLRYSVTDSFGASSTEFVRITVTDPLPTTTTTTVPPTTAPPTTAPPTTAPGTAPP